MSTSQENTNRRSFDLLLESYAACLQLYRELLNTAKQKTELLTAGQDEELQELSKQESKLIQQFTTIEATRHEAIVKLQAELGVPQQPTASISDILSLLGDEAERKSLSEMQEHLLETAEQLRKVNEHNQLLLHQSIAILHDTADAIFGPVEEEVVYQHPNASTTASKRSNGIDYRT